LIDKPTHVRQEDGAMTSLVFLYTAAGLTTLWGIAHLVPTKSVVDGFGDITEDNKRIITMEWIVEGLALILIGTLVAAVAFIDATHTVSKAVYLICSLGLLALAAVSLFTGFKVRFLPFRLCPLIFTVLALLIIVGGLLSLE
jgi:hypothetical protein